MVTFSTVSGEDGGCSYNLLSLFSPIKPTAQTPNFLLFYTLTVDPFISISTSFSDKTEILSRYFTKL